MKQTFIPVFILCFFYTIFSSSLSAQENTNFDLSKYYTPDIVRNKLSFSFGSGGSFNNQISSNDSIYNNSLNGSLSPTFELYKNTRKLVSQLQINGDFQGKSSGNENQNSLYNINRTFVTTESTNNINITYDVRFYNPKKQFLLFGINSNINATGNMNYFTNNTIKTKAGNQNFAGGLRATIGIGFGRIESVEDARQAIYILDELTKKGILSRQLSSDEIFQFSHRISRVKNKRFLDSRLHLIDEITTIDSFFVSNNLLKKSDASYFTTLYDYWQYGALNSRKSGHEFAIRLSPAISLSTENAIRLDSVTWDHGYNNYYRAELSITYNYEKPESLNWQHSANASFSFNSDLNNQATLPQNNYPSIIGKYLNTNAYLQGRYFISYYPNTRTNYSAGLIQILSLFSRDDLKNLPTSTSNYIQSSTSLNFNASYYFSPQFRLSGNAGIGYFIQNQDIYNYSGLNGGLSASLVYSFF